VIWPLTVNSRYASVPFIWLLSTLYLFFVTLYYVATADIHTATEVEYLSSQGFDADKERMRVAVDRNTMLLGLSPVITYLLAIFWVGRFDMGTIPHKHLMSVIIQGEVFYATGLLLSAPIVAITQYGDFSFSAFSILHIILPNIENRLSISILFLLTKIDLFLILELLFIGRGICAIFNTSRPMGYTISILSVGFFSTLWFLILLFFEFL